MAHAQIVLVGGLASWPRRYREFARVLREISDSETLVFDDLYHSQYFGRWYGSDRETVERRWPEELREQHPWGEYRA